MAFVTKSFVAQAQSNSGVAPVCKLSTRMQLFGTGVIPARILRTKHALKHRLVRMSATDSTTQTEGGKLPSDKDPTTVSESEWRQVLSEEEYRILREKGTEYPGTGEYDGFYPKEGHFVCRACGNPLYSASSKFKSGCGWPAFDMCYKGSVATKTDLSFGTRRVEILCARCGGHLGHVFEGERMTPSNERHCVNSISVKYVPEQNDKEESKVV